MLQPDGTYEKPDRRGKAPVNSQEALCRLAEAAAALERTKWEPRENGRVFIPAAGEPDAQ